MTSPRAVRLLVGILVGAATLAGHAGPAAARPVHVGTPAGPVGVGSVGGGADAAEETRTVDLVWDGTRPVVAQEPFVGTPAVAPGDRVSTTLRVRNHGPGAGRLGASVTGVDLLDDEGGPADVFYDELRLEWRSGNRGGSATLRELAAAGTTQIALGRVPRGGSAEVELAYALPASATSLPASQGRRSASFVLHLRIAGDQRAAPTSVGSVAGAWFSPDLVAWEVLPAPGDAPLARTGVDVLRACLVAVVLVGAGGILLGVVRRRAAPAGRPVTGAVGDVPHPG